MTESDKLQIEFNAWFDSLSEDEQREYFGDMEADRVIDEMKSNPYYE